MARSKEQNEALDGLIITALAELPGWVTAEDVQRRVLMRAVKRGLGPVDGLVVGGRLRSLRSRGEARSRTHPDGYMCEWRLA